MRRLVLVSVAVSICLTASLGCDGSDTRPDAASDAAADADTAEDTHVPEPDAPPGAPVEIEELTVTANPNNGLSRYVEWKLNQSAAGELTVDCGDAFRKSREVGPDHIGEAFVMGLWDGASCSFELAVETADAGSATASETVEVGPLPDFLPDLEAPVSTPEQMQPGWTWFNLNNSFDEVPLIIAAVDAQGRYRWYHRRDATGSGAATSVTPLDEGLLVGGTHDRGRIWPAIIGWDGELIWEAELEMHHDIRPWKDDSFLWLGTTGDCPGDIPNSATIHRHDRSSGDNLWTWTFCEHYTPDNPQSDWDHVNAIEPFPDGESLLISSRNTSSLYKIDIGSGEVVWRLGKGGDFERTDADDPLFLRQHAPEIQDNGNVLLFDNGSSGRPYSRAVEFSYEADAETMEAAWIYRPDPDIYASIWSDADRLDNDNTLIAFGRRDEDKGSVIQEVTMDKEVVFELESPNKWGWYRSVRTEPPRGYIQ